MRSVIRAAGALPFVAMLALGCSSAAKPGAPDYSGLSGTLTMVEDVSYEKMLASTIAAMNELDLHPSEWERDGLRALIVGKVIEGKIGQTHELRAHVTRLGETKTQVELRIVGRRNELALRQVGDAIEKRLPRSRPVPSSARFDT